MQKEVGKIIFSVLAVSLLVIIIIGVLWYGPEGTTSNGKAAQFSGNGITGAAHGIDSRGEVCNNVADDPTDTDALADCKDLECRADPCSQQDISKVCVWSFNAGEIKDGKDHPADSNMGCCSSTQCYTSNTCFDYDSKFDNVWNCGSANNWDRCGEPKGGEITHVPGELSDNGNYQCTKKDDGSYDWILIKENNCNNNIDDDKDGKTDCQDTDDCTKGVSCTADGSKVCVWSHLPADNPNNPPGGGQIGCCKKDQCYFWVSGCHDYDTQENPAAPVSNCGDSNDWDQCGPSNSGSNKFPGDLSDGKKYQCSNVASVNGLNRWKLPCNLANKYKLENGDTEICDGTNWRTCEDLNRNPIYDPYVDVGGCKISNTISIREYNCNNIKDDDNDAKTDRVDSADCTNPISYILNRKRYEVVAKSTDDFKFNIDYIS